MGLDRTCQALTLVALLATPALALEPGWHYSPLPGEGDRAALGCDKDATPERFTCLAVRCEDDFSTGLHLYTSLPERHGTWHMTVDRENAEMVVGPSLAPYSGRVTDNVPWLLERLREGTFIYLRHADASDRRFAFIDLGGSLKAINQALAFCAPRVPDRGEPPSL
jgi:hypothetical protein